MDKEKEKAILKAQIEECKRVIYRHDGVLQYCLAQLERLEKENDETKAAELIDAPFVEAAATNGAA